MINKFNEMNQTLIELSDLIKLLRLDENYISIIKEVENGKD
jgi:hypothetical protein